MMAITPEARDMRRYHSETTIPKVAGGHFSTSAHRILTLSSRVFTARGRGGYRRIAMQSGGINGSIWAGPRRLASHALRIDRAAVLQQREAEARGGTGAAAELAYQALNVWFDREGHVWVDRTDMTESHAP